MRSIVGVGMTPPKVLGTPKPASSVMISSTFGAPLGGVTRGGHQGFDCRAPSLMTPPNCGSGGGSCFPVMVEVALGEPRVPLTCCAVAWPAIASAARLRSAAVAARQEKVLDRMFAFLDRLSEAARLRLFALLTWATKAWGLAHSALRADAWSMQKPTARTDLRRLAIWRRVSMLETSSFGRQRQMSCERTWESSDQSSDRFDLRSHVGRTTDPIGRVAAPENPYGVVRPGALLVSHRAERLVTGKPLRADLRRQRVLRFGCDRRRRCLLRPHRWAGNNSCGSQQHKSKRSMHDFRPSRFDAIRIPAKLAKRQAALMADVPSD